MKHKHVFQNIVYRNLPICSAAGDVITYYKLLYPKKKTTYETTPEMKLSIISSKPTKEVILFANEMSVSVTT